MPPTGTASDGETYIEKYIKGVSAVESILVLDRLRQVGVYEEYGGWGGLWGVGWLGRSVGSGVVGEVCGEWGGWGGLWGVGWLGRSVGIHGGLNVFYVNLDVFYTSYNG